MICTSRHAVPGPSISDALFETGVIIIFAAWCSIRVWHHRVVAGVCLCQALKHQVIRAGAVLVGRPWETESCGEILEWYRKILWTANIHKLHLLFHLLLISVLLSGLAGLSILPHVFNNCGFFFSFSEVHKQLLNRCCFVELGKEAFKKVKCEGEE